VTEIDILELLSLAPAGEDRFTHPGGEPLGPFTGMFGGQPMALALRAAGLTVTGDLLPHSLHAYFLRPGTSVEPLGIKVDRDTDGRSFSARSVTVSQNEGVILNLSASFYVSEEGPDLQERHPPEDLDDPNPRLDALLQAYGRGRCP